MEQKTRIDDLAIFSGVPAFAEPLHVGRPNVGDQERLLARFADMLDRRWLTNDGPFTREIEQRIAEYVGVKHCVAMCNGTVALEIAIRALGMTGEVIVPAFTFIATAHALQWQEITPVFCDIDRRTHTIDPEQIESLISPRTTGIIGVHLWGRACRIDRIEEIARRHRFKLLFDAAHAFGCSYNGRMIGGFGHAEVFSFHATKVLNTFEGGAIATNDDELAEKVRLMRNFGFSGYDNVIYIGTNGKMNEASAAMGLTSLESLDEFVAVNRRNYELYKRLLAGIDGLSLIEYSPRECNNYQYIVVEIDPDATGLMRDCLVDLLWAENVLARRYFYPGCHLMEPYRSMASRGQFPLPATEAIANRVLLLPTGTSVNAEAVMKVCEILRLALEHADEIRTRLAP